MFGIDQRCHGDARFARFIESLKNVDADLEAIRERASKRSLPLKRSEVIIKYIPILVLKSHPYSEGDYMMIRNTRSVPGENTKIKLHYKGPYMIDKVPGNNRYVVCDISGFNATSRPLNTVLSSDRIKKNGLRKFRKNNHAWYGGKFRLNMLIV